MVRVGGRWGGDVRVGGGVGLEGWNGVAWGCWEVIID